MYIKDKSFIQEQKLKFRFSITQLQITSQFFFGKLFICFYSKESNK